MHDLKDNSEFYFLTPSIGKKFGGLTTALFRRAHIFTSSFAKRVNVLTFRFSPNHDSTVKYLEEQEFLSNNINLLNLYNYFSACSSEQKMGDYFYGLQGIKRIGDNKYISDLGRIITVSIDANTNAILKMEIRYKDEIEEIREFNEENILMRVRKFKRGKLQKENFYRNDQTVYMEKIFNEAKESEVKKITLFYDNQVLSFKNHLELQKYWLDQLLDPERTNYVITDGRAMDLLVLKYNSKPTVKIFVIHSIHIRAPYDTFSTIRTGNRILLNDLGQADKIVFLTESQKDDITKRFGNRKVFTVIPHSFEPDKNMLNLKKERNRFVVVSRLHQEKQLDHIIKAFSIVKKSGLNFSLDIYGTGDQHKKLQDLINNLELNQNIILKGFTKEPLKEFAKSEASILTSKYEGFGLSIIESLSCKCPVFSYNLKYGPSDLIKDGENGFLIDKDDHKQLAKAIIQYINTPQPRKEEMFNNALKSVDKFNTENFIRKWKDVLETAKSNINERYKLAQPQKISITLNEIGLSEKRLNLSISVDEGEYADKFNGVEIEINNYLFKMENVKSGLDSAHFKLSIPLEDLKNIVEDGSSNPINYFYTLDGIKYKEPLEVSGGITNERISFPWNVYSLDILKDKTIELKRQKLDGIKGLLRFVKYI